MILIFGGTTEGRLAVQVCEAAAKPYFYSSKNGDQQLVHKHARLLSGAMEAEDIVRFCQREDIKLIINAAHPFATLLHRHISEAARTLGLEVLRVERPILAQEGEQIHRVASLDEALQAAPHGSRILALTGVKSASALLPYVTQHHILLRIMDRDASHQLIDQCAFPREQLLYYPSQGEEEQDLLQLVRQHRIDVMICKDSGASGGLAYKMAVAQQAGVTLSIIQRPAIPSFSCTVYGEQGLRRALQRYLPDYFPLKTGLTTGSSATAASCAAFYAALNQCHAPRVDITLPRGECIELAVHESCLLPQGAEARVINDSGDDPSVVHELEIGARVTLHTDEKGISLDGGEGVGRATLPGLDMAVGEAAINSVPRAMITQNIARLMDEYHYTGGVQIEIFIPRGAEIAPRTLNARLGIEGGLSILGTSGIVQPYSAEAFLASLERQVHIIRALHHPHVALSSGAKSEQVMRAQLPDLPAICFLHYGNLIGDTLRLCAQAQLPELTLGLMIGKAVKLAQGALDTHNKQSRMDKTFLQQLAADCGCSRTVVESIATIASARELWGLIPQENEGFFHRLAARCYAHAQPLIPATRLRLLLIAEGGSPLISYPAQDL